VRALRIRYNGQHYSSNSNAIAAPVQPTPPATIKAIKPATNAVVGASVQEITIPVAPGANASISIKTVPTASCNISVIYDKTASKDSGLSVKRADDFGIITWTWTVDKSAPIGTWPVKVTCTYNKKSAVVQADLLVALPKQ
jgi:hypothetical protein